MAMQGDFTVFIIDDLDIVKNIRMLSQYTHRKWQFDKSFHISSLIVQSHSKAYIIHFQVVHDTCFLDFLITPIIISSIELRCI